MRPPVRFLTTGVACWLGALLHLTAAQPVVTVEVPTLVGFQAPINENNRRVGLVSGREAKPSLAAGQLQITDFRLETYRYNPDRETELIVESPLGVFGPGGAASDRHIALRSADARFSIEGEGWAWDKATGMLVISNAVQTSLRRPGAATNRPPIEIRSRRFEYQMTTGDARFLGDCDALEPGQARLRAGELAARLTARTERPTSITATNGVVIELLRTGRTGRASGAAAAYGLSPGGEQIEITGSPTWQFGPAEGSADVLILLPAKDAYTARGHARLRLQRAPRTLLPGETEPEPGEPLEIACEAIEGGPDEVVFLGPVTATHGTRLELRAHRVVAVLDAISSGTDPQPTRVTATGDVAARVQVGPDPLELRGQTMRYTLGEHALIEVDGEPAWRATAHRGRARRFVLHPEVPAFQALGDVAVSWQAAGTPTDAPPIDVTAERLVVERAHARFSSEVRVRRADWDLQSQELDLLLSTNGQPRGVVARGGVEMNYRMSSSAGGTNLAALRPFAAPGTILTEEAGAWRIQAAEVEVGLASTNAEPTTLHATGGVRIDNPLVKASGARLDYEAADGRLRLSGDASMQAASGLVVTGGPETILAYDPRRARFQVDGHWRRMLMPGIALGDRAATGPLLH